MIDVLLKVLKSLEDVEQKESFLKLMGLLASGTFPLHPIILVTFRSLKKILTELSSPLLEYSAFFVGFLIKYVS
jgi:hypothetical protein